MSEFEKIGEYYREFGNRNEDLLSSFTEYEASKLQAAGVRNLINKKLKELEAGLVKFEMAGLETDKNKLQLEQNQLYDDKEILEKKCKELMALEAYGEYRKLKGKLYEAEKSLNTNENDRDELTNQYRQSAGKLKYILDQNLINGSVQKEKMEAILKKCKNDKNAFEAELIKEVISESEKTTEISVLEKKVKALSEEIDKLQKGFTEAGEMDVILDLGGLERKIEYQIKAATEKELKGNERIKTINSLLQALDVKTAEITGEINRAQDSQKRYEDWLEVYHCELTELEKKASGFAKDSLFEYLEELEIRIHKESIGKMEREIEAGRLQQKKQLSGKRGYYVPNEELLSFEEQLSGKCSYIRLGIDFINEKIPDERKLLLKELPFLPFSIIVDGKSFEKLKNGKVKLEFASDYTIPIVNLDTVRGMKDPTVEELFYFCSFTDLLLDGSKFTRYMAGIDSNIEVMHKEIETAEKRLEALNIDFIKLNSFMESYPKEKVKNHIDGIIREISEDGIVDRKRVAYKLSTKELLAQITDMDKAAVRLYKIESIPENSKFYRWEQAVGSEGQNNSLYFIFAACLISFIRMLSITSSSLKSKKVIIADNPFGATSAVYLWNPMFDITKLNDIN